MVDFGERDFKILLSLLVSIILITFAFGSAGLADDSVDTDDIPDLDIDQNTFDVAGDFPEEPSEAEETYSGTLNIDENRTKTESLAVLHVGSFNIRVEMDIETNGDDEVVGVLVTFSANDDDGNTIEEDVYFFDQIGDSERHRYNIDGHEVSLRAELAELDQDAKTASVEYETRYFGDLSAEGGALASIAQSFWSFVDYIIYLANLIAWGIGTGISWLLNVIVIGYEMATFLIGFVSFLTSSYVDIISNTDGMATTIATIPGVLLTLMLSKMAVVIIEAVWIG